MSGTCQIPPWRGEVSYLSAGFCRPVPQKDEPCFTPIDFARVMEEMGIPGPEIHETCILAFTGYDKFCEVLNARHVEGDYWSTFLANSRDEKVTIAKPGIGASAAVMRMEEIIGLGLRRFLFLGTGGSLREDVPIGSIVLPLSAVVDEGTSRHYVGPRERIEAPGTVSQALSAEAARTGTDVIEGAVWTIDAPYREMKSRARQLSGEGVIAVEMESSALFGLGEFREVGVGGLVVVSDQLFPQWRFDPSSSREGIDRARRLVVDVAMGFARR